MDHPHADYAVGGYTENPFRSCAAECLDLLSSREPSRAYGIQSYYG